MPQQNKRYATRIPRSVWKQHSETIETLFLCEDKTLSIVMGTMKRRGFYASESQYGRQLKIWDIQKNWKKGDRSQTTRFFEKIDDMREVIALWIDTLGKLEDHIALVFQFWPGAELEGIVSEDLSDLVRKLSEVSELYNFYVRHVKNMLKERNLPVIPPKWRHFLWVCFHELQMRCMRLEPTLEGLLEMTGEVISIERCILELSKRNINIEDYLSTDGIANPYISDPDLCRHTQCDREELSSSPMQTWDTRMWESMGVTCEEWITRGWDIFFWELGITWRMIG
ncbi:unnamed protein product [Alternaria burnsii]|nr:unnamed protein product [Alternaria burnsii]